MQIQVNPAHDGDGSETVTGYVRDVLEHAASRLGSHITRLEVQLGDENGAKSGVDEKRCMMEARVEMRHPITVTHRAATMNEAIAGAAGKLKRAITHELERQDEHH